MATITEDYCDFETAKLLKEKGFHEDCKCQYGKGGSISWTSCSNGNATTFARPTIQMAMKWLRKKHNILLFILPAQENGKLVYLVEVWTWNEEEGIYESTYAPMPRKEPEQACKEAIKYCLEHLI